jgi:hypothetical protein
VKDQTTQLILTSPDSMIFLPSRLSTADGWA